jgi:tRNA (cytidine/uridine-2'-O-)-methyltransferase
MINIVLYAPDIPQNTGNIARTCALTDTKLHLIQPLGFSLDEKYVRRAGLDYWDLLEKQVYENFEDFLACNPVSDLYFLTTKSKKKYSDIEYSENAYLVFGSETRGLPVEIHEKYPENRFRIPMLNHKDARSLNLSNAVNIVLYEALRQNNFFDLV